MKAIPKIKEPEKYEVTDFTYSDFVQITSDEFFDVQMQYPVLGMKYAEPLCYVRKEVSERLLNAAKHLPKGYRFRIWDAWRPFALQDELYDVYSADIIKKFGLKDCGEEQKRFIISRFVSAPIADKTVPPVHTTGGAVDVTIIDETGNELDMGTRFDAFTDLTYTAAFENEKDQTVRDNRRLIYNIMTSAGFTNLPSEWWHYDYGDRFWAYYNNKPAIYEGIFTREEIHEGV